MVWCWWYHYIHESLLALVVARVATRQCILISTQCCQTADRSTEGQPRWDHQLSVLVWLMSTIVSCCNLVLGSTGARKWDGNFGRSQRNFRTKSRLSSFIVSTCRRYQSVLCTQMHFIYTAYYSVAHWPFSEAQRAQKHFSANLHTFTVLSKIIFDGKLSSWIFNFSSFYITYVGKICHVDLTLTPVQFLPKTTKYSLSIFFWKKIALICSNVLMRIFHRSHEAPS